MIGIEITRSPILVRPTSPPRICVDADLVIYHGLPDRDCGLSYCRSSHQTGGSTGQSRQVGANEAGWAGRARVVPLQKTAKIREPLALKSIGGAGAIGES